MSDANLQIGIESNQAVAGSRTVVRSLDDIYSSAASLDMKLRTMESTLGRVGANAGLTQAKAAIQSLQSPLQSVRQELERIESRIIRVGATAVALGAVNLVLGKIRETLMGAIKAVDDFQIAVISIAASLTQIQVANGSTDLAGAYEKSSRYAGQLALKLQEIDKQSFANYKGLMAMTQVMTAQGQVLDINNKKQVEAFTNLSNAIAIMTPGQDQQMQMYQETRALLSGIVDRHSQVARMIDQQIKAQGIYKGGLKEVAELGRKHGDTIERLAPYLQGIGAASGDIAKTWSTAVATFETALNFIQRQAFGSIVKDLTQLVNLFSTGMSNNAGKITQELAEAWSHVRYAVFDVDAKTKEMKFSQEFLNTLKTAGNLIVALIDTAAIFTKWMITHSEAIKNTILLYAAWKASSIVQTAAVNLFTTSISQNTAAQTTNTQTVLSSLETETIRLAQKKALTAAALEQASANRIAAAEELAHAEWRTKSLLSEQNKHGWTLKQTVAIAEQAKANRIATQQMVNDNIRLAESEVALSVSRVNAVEQHLALIASEMNTLKAKGTLTAKELAFEKELRFQQMNNLSKLIVLNGELSIAEQQLNNVRVKSTTTLNAAIASERATTIAKTEAVNVAARNGFAIYAAKELEIKARAANSAAIAAENVALSANTAAVSAATVSTRLLVGVKTLLSGAIAALGGPLGAILTALTLGATAWYIWGKNAKEATGGSYADSIDAMTSKIQQQNKELKERNRLAAGGTTTDSELEMIAKEEAKLASLKKSINELGGPVTLKAGESFSTLGGKVKSATESVRIFQLQAEATASKIARLKLAIQERESLNEKAPKGGTNALGDDKGAEAAKKWASTYEQLRKEIDLLNPSMSELDRKILDVTQKYADLERKKGANIEKLRQLKSEHVDAIRTQYEIAEAIKATSNAFAEYLRIAGEETTAAQAAESMEDYLKGIRESIAAMNPAKKAAKDVADAVYDIGRAFEEPDQAGAIDQFIENLFKLKELQEATNDIYISMADSDPATQQMTQIEERYRREKELIDEKMQALKQANLTETAAYKTLSNNLIAMAAQREKQIADIQRKESEAGFKAVVDIAARFEPQLVAVNDLIAAMYSDHTKYRVVEEQQGSKKIQKLVEDENRTKLSMISAYTAAAGSLFQGLAAAQDTASREGFETAKDLNIAAATMNTAAAITQALANLPPPASYAMAATSFALGMQQVQSISKTSFGGKTSLVAPGTLAASSNGKGVTGSGAGSLVSAPYMNVQQSQSATDIDRIVKSIDSAALAIGRVADSFLRISEMMQSTMIEMLMRIVPGKYVADVSTSKYDSLLSTSITFSKSLIKESLNSITSFLRFDLDGIFSSISNTFKSIGSALFGSGWKDRAAGITVELAGGNLQLGSYIKQHKSGGLFGSSKDRYVSVDGVDRAFEQGMQSFFGGLKVDIMRAAAAFGISASSTQAGFNRASVGMVRVQTSGRTEDEIIADFEKQVQQMSDALAGTIPKLKDFAFGGEYLTDTLARLATAMLNVNDTLDLIGAKAIRSTGGLSDAAYKLQELMGGAEQFQRGVSTYFETMFSDAEQDVRKAEQAQRYVNKTFTDIRAAAQNKLTQPISLFDYMFAEMDRHGTVDGVFAAIAEDARQLHEIANIKMPNTREEFVKLVNSLDLTSEHGAQAFAALMDVSEAFGVLMDTADKLAKKQQQITRGLEDLDVRMLRATGFDDAAEDMQQKLYKQRELEQAITDEMGEAYITKLQAVLDAEQLLFQKNKTTQLIDLELLRKNDIALQQNLDIREAELAGRTEEAALMRLRLQQLDELNIAVEKGLNVERLQIVQQKEWEKAVKETADKTAEAVKQMVDTVRSALSDAVSSTMTVLSAMRNLMVTGAGSIGPTESYARSKMDLYSADADNVVERVNTFLSAAKSISATREEYERDTALALAKMGEISETAPTLSYVDQQIQLLQQIQDAIKSGNDDVVVALGVTFNAAQIEMGTANNDLIRAFEAIQNTLNFPIQSGTAKPAIEQQIQLLQQALNNNEQPLNGTAADAINVSIAALQLALNNTITSTAAQSAIDTAYLAVQAALNKAIDGTSAANLINAQKNIMQAAANGLVDGSQATSVINSHALLIQAALNKTIDGQTAAVAAQTQAALVQAVLNGTIDGQTATAQINQQRNIIQNALDGVISSTYAKQQIEDQYSEITTALNKGLNTGSSSLSSILGEFSTAVTNSMSEVSASIKNYTKLMYELDKYAAQQQVSSFFATNQFWAGYRYNDAGNSYAHYDYKTAPTTIAAYEQLMQQTHKNMDQMSSMLNSNYLDVTDVAMVQDIYNRTQRNLQQLQQLYPEFLRSITDIPQFAAGGITTGLSFAGEAGPEAVVPLPDGRSIPVSIRGTADNRKIEELLAEIRGLRAEVTALRQEQRIGHATIADNTGRAARKMDKFDKDGLNIRAAA